MLFSNIMTKFIPGSLILVFFSSFSSQVAADRKNSESCKEYFYIEDIEVPSKKHIRCNYEDGNYAIYSIKTSKFGKYCSYVQRRVEGTVGDPLYQSFFYSTQESCEYVGQARVRFYTGQSEADAYQLLIDITEFLESLANHEDKLEYAGVNIYEGLSYDFKEFFIDFEKLSYGNTLDALVSVENNGEGDGYTMTLRLKERLWSVSFYIKSKNINFYKVVVRI